MTPLDPVVRYLNQLAQAVLRLRVATRGSRLAILLGDPPETRLILHFSHGGRQVQGRVESADRSIHFELRLQATSISYRCPRAPLGDLGARLVALEDDGALVDLATRVALLASRLRSFAILKHTKQALRSDLRRSTVPPPSSLPPSARVWAAPRYLPHGTVPAS